MASLAVMWVVLCWLSISPVAFGAKRGLDASSTLPEHQWYSASHDWIHLTQYCRTWSGERQYMCVDTFSHSRKFERAFQKLGFAATSFDVKNSDDQDITSPSGFRLLLDMILQTLDGAFLPVAPPCSLYVGISQGTHKRSAVDLLGDISLKCVRLSNLILANTATLLMLAFWWRPTLRIMVEQPMTSWLFKQEASKDFINIWDLKRYLTHLGIFGHDLLKSTHLYSNMATLSAVVRKATKAVRAKHRNRMERKIERAKAQGKYVKVYYVKNDKGFHGGPDLASSASYPAKFVSAVVMCWQNQHEGKE
mmetsp:Transcript_70551/g.155575  ORF Transcript_70551/g.155575 Transcript_70551/m.155575 type:complete len:307 (+) Transcript_70551:117-1037(+)